MKQISRTALGLGLRVPHYHEYYEQWPQIDFVEIITENYLGSAIPPREHLRRIAERYPVVLHGVSLNLLSADPLDMRYLDEVAELCDWLDVPYFTDHLCWVGVDGQSHHDLLPTPYTLEIAEYAAERARAVQAHVGRPFGIENLSSYVDFKASAMPEWAFYNKVIADSGCWAMLDINNVFVSSVNHAFDPMDYLRSIDYERVLQVHMAGHTVRPDGLIIDTHDQPVRDEVWALYRNAWRIGGPFPTLLEWDDHIPPLADVVAEVSKAKLWRSTDGAEY